MIKGNIDIVNYFAQRYLRSGMTVLDIGGANLSTLPLQEKGNRLTILDIKRVNSPSVRSIQADFYQWIPDQTFDVIWCSHTLEHAKNVGLFLNKMIKIASDNAIFVIIVPPARDNLVGGHINSFTPATLCYNIILSGQNLSRSSVITHEYNIAVIWRRFDWPLPALKYDRGDIETLNHLFPKKVHQGINGKQGWDKIRADDFDEILTNDASSETHQQNQTILNKK
ncbi:hypothetical protein LCGC14_2201270 [marine sediment metagenome]|uniref:Methyltransferase type 11 domain-containing protein n=1 Tax=marine sediment metagenome TaxID=412755 RepID=A0A0F9DGM8_9ZZZZ